MSNLQNNNIRYGSGVPVRPCRENITIGIVSPSDIEDRRASSGTIYKIAQSLRRGGYCIKWIPVRYNHLPYRIIRHANILVRRISGLDFAGTYRLKYARRAAESIDTAELDKCDILFFPIQSNAMYQLEHKKPVIYLSDATFEVMVDYYWKGMTPSEIKAGNEIDRYALEHSNAIILSSQWAANSAVNYYNQPSNKVHIIEFGANNDDCDIVRKEHKYNGQIDLLFLGVDWERKGGKIAVEACRYLNAIGCKAVLHIVGIKDLDDDIKKLPYIVNDGFLDKNFSEQYYTLVSIIQRCHCLLLPTLAECSAIAFAESSAFGLPIFSHETGGVSNYVFNGKNGYMLPLGSTGEDFGRKIKQCLDNGELESMSSSAVNVYRERLNWDTWTEKVSDIINSLLTVE